jgi:hypothetical protein
MHYSVQDMQFLMGLYCERKSKLGWEVALLSLSGCTGHWPLTTSKPMWLKENDSKLARCFKPFPFIPCTMLELWLIRMLAQRFLCICTLSAQNLPVYGISLLVCNVSRACWFTTSLCV